MNKLQLLTNSLLALSQISHIFCCGIPMLCSLITLMANFGAIGVFAEQAHFFHHIIHDYEGLIFLTITALLALAWALHFISLKMDCLKTGCHHPPCSPKKGKSAKILWVSTFLYCANIVVYLMIVH